MAFILSRIRRLNSVISRMVMLSALAMMGITVTCTGMSSQACQWHLQKDVDQLRHSDRSNPDVLLFK